jgi:hypothetical protein
MYFEGKILGRQQLAVAYLPKSVKILGKSGLFACLPKARQQLAVAQLPKFRQNSTFAQLPKTRRQQLAVSCSGQATVYTP